MEALDELKPLIYDEQTNLMIKIRKLNPSISSSSSWFTSSDSDQEKPTGNQVTYANPELNYKIPEGRDTLFELL